MKNIGKLSFFLLALSALCAALVAGVNDMTTGVIEKIQEDSLRAGYAEIYPDFDNIKEVRRGSGESLIKRVLLAEKGGQSTGVVYIVTSNGYSGEIEFLAAFDLENQNLTGVKVLRHGETPGLGANCVKTQFSGQFAGKSASEGLAIVKTAAAQPNEIQAITASTITSRAVVLGVNAAREDFIANYGRKG